MTAGQKDGGSDCGLDSSVFLLEHVLVLDKGRALLNIFIYYLYFASC